MATPEGEAYAEPWCVVADSGSVVARFGILDCRPVDALNRCRFRAPGWARDASGRLRAGALMVLADHMLGEIPYKYGPGDRWALTTELTVDIVGGTDAGTELYGGAAQVHAAAAGSFVQGQIDDGAGHCIAVATTRVAYVPAVGPVLTRFPEPVASDVVSAMALEEVLGLTYRRSAEGVLVTMAQPDAWVNDFGIPHGGVAACVAEVAASRLIADRNPELTVAQLHSSYLRSPALDEPYIATARGYHVGKGFAVAEVLGRSAGGRLCTVSTVTARRSDGYALSESGR